MSTVSVRKITVELEVADNISKEDMHEALCKLIYEGEDLPFEVADIEVTNVGDTYEIEDTSQAA